MADGAEELSSKHVLNHAAWTDEDNVDRQPGDGCRNAPDASNVRPIVLWGDLCSAIDVYWLK